MPEESTSFRTVLPQKVQGETPPVGARNNSSVRRRSSGVYYMSRFVVSSRDVIPTVFLSENNSSLIHTKSSVKQRKRITP